MRMGTAKRRVFCDFDGTVAQRDVGELLFETFTEGDGYAPVRRWLRGEISSKECLEAQCAAAKVSQAALERFISEQRLDPYFSRFVRRCQANNVPVTILSDGLDFYVERLLARYGLGDVPFFANYVSFKDGKLRPTFPYRDSQCPYRNECGGCGNCKVSHIRRLRQQGEMVFYVGDGFSDRWAAQEADVVFAKGNLLHYCREHRVHCIEYGHFGDVLEHFESISTTLDG